MDNPIQYVRLQLPRLLDFSTLKPDDEGVISICNTQHKFAENAQPSGTNVMKQPIFGSRVSINGKKFSKQSYGLPFMQFLKVLNQKSHIKTRHDSRLTFIIMGSIL